jgi:hypothetical protein
VVIGFSRIPYAKQYNDFSVTTTNEKYCAISTITNAATTDPYAVIGRFEATLSATANFYWSVPTYTPVNLIQYPIWNTRRLAYALIWAASGTAPSIGNGILTGYYQVTQNFMNVYIAFVYGSTTTFGTGQYTWSLPFTPYTLQPASVMASTGTIYTGVGVQTGASVQVGSNGGSNWWGQTIPATWANGNFGYIGINAWLN